LGVAIDSAIASATKAVGNIYGIANVKLRCSGRLR
jgi:hypothetical protein